MTTSVTWWGSATVELRVGERTLVIDPYLQPTDGAVNYICISHDHYDHCHPPTLRKLVADPAFERILLPRSASEMPAIDSVVDERSAAEGLGFIPAERMTVMYPKYKRERAKVHPGPTEFDFGDFSVETVDSSERPWRYKSADAGLWPEGKGRFVGAAEYPNLGYVVSHEGTGATFYHPGDLGEIYDELRGLRGRVDYMFFPLAKLEGMELSMLDAVRPRYIIPLHYRVETPGFPIPLTVRQEDLTATNIGKGGPDAGADPDVYRADLQRKIGGHWFPTPIPPLDRIMALEPVLREHGAELLILEAGRPYDLA